MKKTTDRADGLKLAQLSAVGQLPLVHVPTAKRHPGHAVPPREH